MRLSIDEYASRFDLSIETVHTQLRNREIEYSIEDGVVYILLRSVEPQQTKTTSGTILALYQKENHELKEKVHELESKIDRLINDKEEMLRDERSRIETLYQNKDEQLKNILELIHTKLKLSQNTPISAPNQEEIQMTETDFSMTETAQSEPVTPHKISLRQYLKNIGYEAQERRLIKRRFAGAYGSDIRVLQHNGEFFLDLGKFDYSDLLKLH